MRTKTEVFLCGMMEAQEELESIESRTMEARGAYVRQ